MMTTIAPMSGTEMTGFERGRKEASRPKDNVSAPGTQHAAADHNPLRRLVDWFLQGNAADRKAACDLADMIDRLSKLPPHLLDDIGLIAEPRKARDFAPLSPAERHGRARDPHDQRAMHSPPVFRRHPLGSVAQIG